MKVFAYIIVLLLFGSALTRADSSITLESRDVLATHGPLAPGDVLIFPSSFRLDFNAERGLATSLLTGNDAQGHPYACAFAISAETEVKFPDETHWTVISRTIEGDVQKLTLAQEQGGATRPLEFRCSDRAELNLALQSRGVKLTEQIPVELIDDSIPAPATMVESPSD